MKWFKHITDSSDDPFIYDLMKRFGPFGYVVFFSTLEVYAREFKPQDGWKLRVAVSYLRDRLQLRQSTRLINCLQYIATKDRVACNSRSTQQQLTINSSSTRHQLVINSPSTQNLANANSGKWQVEFNGTEVLIYIPKFTELLDEWTLKKLRSYKAGRSGVTPKNLRTDKEEDKDIYNPPTPLTPLKPKRKGVRKEPKITEPKIKFLDCVYLTKKQHEKLIAQNGEGITAVAIEKVNHYKMAKGRTYKSDYHAILSWGLDRAREGGNDGRTQRGYGKLAEPELPPDAREAIERAKRLSAERRERIRNQGSDEPASDPH